MPAIAERKELASWTPVGAVRIKPRTAFTVGVLLIAFSAFVLKIGLQSGDRPENRIVIPAAALFMVMIAVAMIVFAQRERRRLAVLAERSRLDPDRPWLWEYNWDQNRMADRTSGKWRNTGAFALAMSVIIGPLQFVIFARGMDVTGAIIFGLFDLFLIVTLGAFVYLGLRRMKYGVAVIRLSALPIQPGDDFTTYLTGAAWLSSATRIEATLRCIEEKIEIRGSGKNRGPRIVPYRLYEDSQTLDAATIRQLGSVELPLVFRVPPDGASTAIEPGPPTYWDLEIAGSTPGIDFGAHFLVPIYRQQ